MDRLCMSGQIVVNVTMKGSLVVVSPVISTIDDIVLQGGPNRLKMERPTQGYSRQTSL